MKSKRLAYIEALISDELQRITPLLLEEFDYQSQEELSEALTKIVTGGYIDDASLKINELTALMHFYQDCLKQQIKIEKLNNEEEEELVKELDIEVESMEGNVLDEVAIYKDFPKVGVDFMDINSLLLDPEKLNGLTFSLLESFKGENSIGKIDKVVAIESRGFILGAPLAIDQGAGLVLVRKPGKLPGLISSRTYATEYSTDTLEMQSDAIQPGDRVIIHDDVLATGGTAKAVKDLVESKGGIVVAFSFLIEIESIEGRLKLNSDNIRSLKIT